MDATAYMIVLRLADDDAYMYTCATTLNEQYCLVANVWILDEHCCLFALTFVEK